MTTAFSAAQAATAAGARLRVMIVDDAIVVRGLFARWIEAEPDLELIASLRNGREAVDAIDRVKPDVVVLDVDMPELDGISALPQLLSKRPGVTVIMASTLTRRNAEISLRALALGATDYITKPSSQNEINAATDFHRDLIEKIRCLGRRAHKPVAAPPAPPAEPMTHILAPPLVPQVVPAAKPLHYAQQHGPITLRPMPLTAPRAILIGASTGGPQALNKVLTNIDNVIAQAPVLITQHMPPTFTAILSEHLSRLTRRPVHEAVHGEEIVAGSIYMAPGGRHMSVTQSNGAPVIEISNGAPINFCKPAVDPLFTSAAQVWGARALAVVLTGMGHDGLAGAHDIINAGGHVIAQDEATSVVWGMPGQVALAGLCSAVLPIDDIGPKLSRLFAGDRA
ncbi:two-component system response regulator protein-glutamate methylesterase [Pseudolabrys sp. Root1462]|uniref:protein-glutamate methylesterase/protein-glutamine glutaminase n=1 Tax=Pseudolabrys sp. Root1462 TaxID=1736466 RepID=UPI000702BB35|nr:chemotaxis response regulator protein-glutamate methylesterase [Pseudolabrys sp. Root1462]KQZ01978.1 two-component system response regulator protein-glutamate methylesterase [Pseudolabrys sp. Root1462]